MDRTVYLFCFSVLYLGGFFCGFGTFLYFFHFFCRGGWEDLGDLLLPGGISSLILGILLGVSSYILHLFDSISHFSINCGGGLFFDLLLSLVKTRGSTGRRAYSYFSFSLSFSRNHVGKRRKGGVVGLGIIVTIYFYLDCLRIKNTIVSVF